MTKLHITQDADGFWMLSVERDNCPIQLMAYHFVTPNHLLSDALEMASDDGDFPGAVVLIDPPKVQPAVQDRTGGSYQRPSPKSTID